MGLDVKWEERAKSQLPARHRQCWVPLAEGRWGTIPPFATLHTKAGGGEGWEQKAL